MALFCPTFVSPTCPSRNFPNQRLFLTIDSVPPSPTSSQHLRKHSISIADNFYSLSPCSRKTPCFSSSSSEPSPEIDHNVSPPAIVFVKGLAKSTSDQSLRTVFSHFGDVSRVKVITDKKARQSLGFAYIWFSSEEFAHRAVEEMNGKFFEGSFIYVTTARPGSCKARAKAAPYKF